METQEIATHIVQKLVQAGHIAYFAGGWVRDYIMGHPSYDIDIATDAPPQKILDIFPNTIHVGMAFGVVIVSMHGKQFEIATFRKDIGYEDGRTPLRIESATPQEDAQRRDFTINGMFYDPIEEKIYDYVNGTDDIKKEVIRTIGNPHERFWEDRLRMIRAIRFSAKLGFSIELETQEAIAKNAYSLFPAVSMERIWQEFNRMAKNPRFDYALVEMHRLKLLGTIFPELESIHLHDIKKAVSSFSHFPQEATTIAFLLELFPNKDLKGVEEMCRYLKAANKDIKFASLLLEARQLVSQENEGYQYPEHHKWSQFYAHPQAFLCLEIIAARYSNEERKSFLEKNHERSSLLHPHIQRIQERRPVVSASHLQEYGIQGKSLGPLLKEAENISINQNLENPDDVIRILKQSPLWVNA